MSMDDTSHVGWPELDELVPSRYALKVGAIDVLVVSDGVLTLPGKMLGHNADPAARAVWLKDMFLPPDMLEWALNQVVVRSGGRTILIDSGIGGGPGLELAAGREVGPATGGCRHRPRVRNRRGADPHAHGSRWRATRRRGEGAAASGPADPRGGRRGRVRLASGGDRLTFVGDLVFAPGFDHPDWYNGFEHDPEEAARLRVNLLRELAANREALVATHLSFPSVCHVAVDGDVFRWVPGPWEY